MNSAQDENIYEHAYKEFEVGGLLDKIEELQCHPNAEVRKMATNTIM